MGTPLLVAIHLFCTFYLTGLIWTVQAAQYPAFSHIEKTGFAAFHKFHMRSMSAIVMLPMIVEAGTGLALMLRPVPGLPPAGVLAGAVLIGLIWISTVFFQIPQHRKLRKGFDAAACRALITGNWFRTVCWSLRSAVWIAILAGWK